MTVGELLTEGQSDLRKANISSAHIDSELLMAHVSGQTRTWVVAHPEAVLEVETTSKFKALIERRAAREPLVHLTGKREFYGLDFDITPDVLTPRIETEQMVEWAIKFAPASGKLIDIGTGSGAIAIAIAKHRPDLTITGTEISPSALDVARRNAQVHKAKITLVESDLWSNISETFDIIVTNLPYLRDDAKEELMEEVKHEPTVALFGGEDGLELYREFLSKIHDHLVVGGYLFTECDPWQHESLILEAAEYELEPVKQGYFIIGFERKEQTGLDA